MGWSILPVRPPSWSVMGAMGVLCEPLGGALEMWRGWGAAKGLEGRGSLSQCPLKGLHLSSGARDLIPPHTKIPSWSGVFSHPPYRWEN